MPRHRRPRPAIPVRIRVGHRSPVVPGLVVLAVGIAVFSSCGHASAEGPMKADIPADYLALYRAAGSTCPGLDWATLAAIGKIETNHGRSNLPGVHSGANYAGAMGEMQFEPGTWDAVRARHPQIGPNVYDPADAIPAAAWYLCDSGASRDLSAAVFQYNHADWYVREVLDQAKAYRAAG